MKINHNNEISEITHDKDNSQLTLEIDGSIAYVDYKLRKNRFYLTYAKIPTALRGRGIGKILVNKSLEKLIEEGYDKEHRIIAKCPFIKYVVAKSEKWRDIVEH